MSHKSVQSCELAFLLDGAHVFTATGLFCLALVSCPVWSDCGVHLVLGWLQDHSELSLQTGQTVAWWDGQSEALQDPGQEEEELHLGQGLTQTHSQPSTKGQVAGWWDRRSCAVTVQEPACGAITTGLSSPAVMVTEAKLAQLSDPSCIHMLVQDFMYLILKQWRWIKQEQDSRYPLRWGFPGFPDLLLLESFLLGLSDSLDNLKVQKLSLMLKDPGK